jgi:hypothetical protein
MGVGWFVVFSVAKLTRRNSLVYAFLRVIASGKMR